MDGAQRALHRVASNALLTHHMAGHEGVGRVSPEWMWRDFRLRLSRGRNHGSEKRLRRAGTVFTIYRNFTPAQQRRDRKRQRC
jgi:hypothetical protein